MPSFLQNTSFSLAGFDYVVGLALYFYLFAVFGWLIEMMYLATAGRGLINSGFLQGPVCPAYAAGVLIIYPFTLLFAPLPFWLQCILYALLATAVEFLAHFALEKLLNIRIWDYSDEFMNLQGRISLKYSAFWFVLVLVLVLVLQPAAITLIEWLEPATRYWLAGGLGLVLLADYVFSAVLFARMRARVSRVCAAFGLPEAEMQDLQFNRPRIMNEKKRVDRLLADPDYAALESATSAMLSSGEGLGRFGFKAEDYADITEHPAYSAWRDSSPENRATCNRFLHSAELAWAFCSSEGLDAKAAARGLLYAAYKAGTGSLVDRSIDFMTSQGRIYTAVRCDIRKPGRAERDVLFRYKWPLNLGPPHTAECLLASFAAKLVESREYRAVLGRVYDAARA